MHHQCPMLAKHGFTDDSCALLILRGVEHPGATQAVTVRGCAGYDARVTVTRCMHKLESLNIMIPT